MTIPKTDLPIVGAPMAGGPTTVPLALAVAEAGGLPFLAGANKTPDALAAEIDTLIESGHPFGVNLFVLRDRPVNEPAFRGYAESLRPEAEKYGIDLESTPARNDDEWSAKLRLLIEREVPLVSLTFGL
ncbi:MAG: nitronate monooxygenase, partial [Solirubrobacterales bacterium]|nr:nitronate monooxygenase [Solirubrobacterales bacterium]